MAYLLIALFLFFPAMAAVATGHYWLAGICLFFTLTGGGVYALIQLWYEAPLAGYLKLEDSHPGSIPLSSFLTFAESLGVDIREEFRDGYERAIEAYNLIPTLTKEHQEAPTVYLHDLAKKTDTALQDSLLQKFGSSTPQEGGVS